MRIERWGVFLVVLCTALLAAPAHAAFPGENGKIAVGVSSQVDRYEFHFNIYVVNPDGSGSTVLTSDNESYTPAWSPDGSKIAFGSDRGGNSGVYTMNADGSNATRLTTDPAVQGLPAWSPDGSKIAFVRSSDIYTMNADGSGFTQLTSGPESDSRPSWSPRGNEIAFQRNRWDPSTATSRTAIYLVDTDGTDVRQLVADHAGSPDWSPDGRKIAFSNNYWGGIWVVDVDAGTAPVRLTHDPHTSPTDPFVAYDDTPAWSPDGTKVAFSRVECGPGECGSSQLLLINADGTGTQQVSYGNSPDWQPLVNEPPECSGVTATPSSLRHHGFQTVTLAGATDPDGDAVTITITGVTQDEPVGQRLDARAGDSTNQVDLRGQRHPRGDGRVYRIAFTASDGTDECSGVATAEVRRKKNQSAVDSALPSYDSFQASTLSGGSASHEDH